MSSASKLIMMYGLAAIGTKVKETDIVVSGVSACPCGRWRADVEDAGDSFAGVSM